MKLPFARASLTAVALLAAIVLLAAASCASSAQPRKDARSRATCEQLLRHSFELLTAASTLALDDHKYQRRKIEADLRRQEEELKNSPTFLQSCNELTEAEYTCMSTAADWFSYTACYAPTDASTEARNDASTDAQATQAPDEAGAGEPALDHPTAGAPPRPAFPPCPAVDDLGRGLATITGTMRSEDASADPLVGHVVSLTIDGTRSHGETLTDEQGRFTFQDIEPGIYQLVPLENNLEGLQRCVAARGGSTTTVELIVRRRPEPPAEVIILDPGKPAKKPR